MCELLKLNVNEHTEKKGQLTYLSWAWAWSTVLNIDPLATWEAVEFNGMPCAFLPDTSAMVKTVVTIKGHTKSCWLPVMDNKNKAIKNPDAFAINTAIVRCLTKAISMHGLGLYIYAGEDLPQVDFDEDKILADMRNIALTGTDKLKAAYEALPCTEQQRAEFWKQHGAALRRAAAVADKATNQPAKEPA